MDKPVFGKIDPRDIDKTKLLAISMEMLPVGVEFEKKLKEIAKKYNADNPAEVSESIMAIIQTLINTIAGETQALHIMIELLHRQHMHVTSKDVIPMDDAKELLKKMEMDNREGSNKEIDKMFQDMMIEKKFDGKNVKDDRPSYLG